MSNQIITTMIDGGNIIGKVSGVTYERVQAKIEALEAGVADTDQRIDNLITTPVPTGEIIAEEIIDARDGEVSVGAKIRSVDAHLTDNANLIGWELAPKHREAKPLVTFVSDDGSDNDYTKLKPIFEPRGVPATLAFISATSSMTLPHMKELYDLGWEFSSHSENHKALQIGVDNGVLTNAEMWSEMYDSKQQIEAMGFPCTTICYPYGRFDDTTRAYARKIYRAARSSKNGSNVAPIDTYALKSVFFGESDVIMSLPDENGVKTDYNAGTLEYYKYWVDRAEWENSWVIFLMHASYSVEMTPTQFQHLEDLIDYIQSKNIEIKTLDKALDTIGNPIDVGNAPNGEFFKVGADGSIWSNKIDHYISSYNEYTNDSLITDFIPNKTTYTTIQSDFSAGFPEGKAGTLVTERFNPEVSVSLGHQFYYVIASNNIYFRHVDSFGEWFPWEQANANVIISPKNGYTATSSLSLFPTNKITYTTITAGSSATGFPPNNTPGVLVTNRVFGDYGADFQVYYSYNKQGVYTRYSNTDGSWGVWEKDNDLTKQTVIIAAPNSFNGLTPITSFQVNKITKNMIAPPDAGLPVQSSGILTTNKFSTIEHGWNYQTYRKYGSNDMWTRYATGSTTWSAWVKITVV